MFLLSPGSDATGPIFRDVSGAVAANYGEYLTRQQAVHPKPVFVFAVGSGSLFQPGNALDRCICQEGLDGAAQPISAGRNRADGGDGQSAYDRGKNDPIDCNRTAFVFQKISQPADHGVLSFKMGINPVKN